MGNTNYTPYMPTITLSDFLLRKSKKVLVVGTIGYDQRINMLEMPKVGETKIADINISFGGKGNIEAVACGRTGEDTIFLGAVGEKDHSIFQKYLESNNVYPLLKRVINTPSHTASILIEKDGKNRIIIDPRASYHVDINLVTSYEEVFEKSNYILLQLEISLDTVEYIINKYKDKKTIILRPSPAREIGEEKEKLKQMIKKVDYLILNEIELSKITGKPTKNQEEIESACKEIKAGIKNLIVPLTDYKGWLLYNGKNDPTEFTSYDLGKPKDYIGVMDCFIGVFASFLCKNYEVNEAIKYAILASNSCASREGAIDSLPTLDELMKKKNNLEKW